MKIAQPSSDQSPQTAADRAFRLLRALHELGPGAHALDTLTRLTGLARSTTHRILQSAVREGAVLQCGYGRYRLARHAAPPSGQLPHLPVSLEIVGAELAALCHRAGRAAFLHVPVMLRPPLRVSLWCSHAPGADPVPAPTDGDRAGLLFRAPLHTDAAGLVLLANLPGAAPEQAGLERIRALGHARTPSPLPGWDLVSAPVRRGAATVASVSLLIRRSETKQSHKLEAAVVMETAARLSRTSRTPVPGGTAPPGGALNALGAHHAR
ncbi:MULTISPECIES: helix-turn-helix domain-containing protein [Streptomyces]|uniref:Regulatory protein n=1 Tax=Streptomyces luteocolor TaxID=285500 RepID=A0A125SZC8_9ACTN|nr:MULTISPECIES: helix-turn-helix domain-containing protein [Streptomyces]BAU50932.1 regulatory protein [Streptomyces luteocolor]